MLPPCTLPDYYVDGVSSGDCLSDSSPCFSVSSALSVFSKRGVINVFGDIIDSGVSLIETNTEAVELRGINQKWSIISDGETTALFTVCAVYFI